jgi:hypothetical protein
MKRMHLFEFMDLSWYPKLLRDLQTNILLAIMTRSPAFDSAVPYIDGLLEQTESHQVIDLCSGASGPWPRLVGKLAFPDARVLLSDKYPNVRMFTEIEDQTRGRVTGATYSVDALQVPASLQGVRTIFTAFHHFREQEIDLILADAQAQGQALCVFDYVPNKVMVLALSPLTFVISFLQFFFLSFTVRPFTWKQLLFTNILPIVPIVAAWDGFVSAMRKYDAEALRSIVTGRDTATYTWEVGTDRSYSQATPLTYLVGKPHRAES